MAVMLGCQGMASYLVLILGEAGSSFKADALLCKLIDPLHLEIPIYTLSTKPSTPIYTLFI